MLEFTVMTPWEFREKEEKSDSRFYFSYSDSLGSTNKEVFNKIFMRDLDDWEEKGVDNLVPELLSEPVYAEYIGLFHGNEADDSPLRICPDGYTLKCDSYRCLANTVYSDILQGLVILAQEKYSYRIVVNGMNELAVRFLANRDETYRVVISAFSDFPRTLALSFGDLSERITINGKPISLQAADEICEQYEELNDDILKFQDKPMRMSEYDLMTDVSSRMSSKTLAKRSGFDSMMSNFKVVIHDNNLRIDFYPIEHPYIYAVEQQGETTCGSPCCLYAENIAQLAQAVYEDALSRSAKEVSYAVWRGYTYYNTHCFNADLFIDVEMYIFADKEKNCLHIYSGENPFGRERFFKPIRKG